MDEEIVVTVSPGEETPPPVETPAPVIVVTETPANSGTDPAAVLSMEMLFAQLTEARQEIDSLRSQVDFLSEWQSMQGQRIAELETDEEIEDDSEVDEIVAEVIPAAVIETPPESSEAPRERKRKFV